MSIRLDGSNPLSYMGVTPVSPPQFEIHGRAPTANDSQGFNLGTIWQERNTENFWILSNLSGGQATWTPFSNGADTFNTDVGGPAIPLNGVLNVFGTPNEIVTTGAGNTITISAGDGIATTYDADVGNANPAGGILNIDGGSNINTSGAGNTITVNLNNSIVLPATTVNELNGVISIGTSPFIQALGTNNTFIGADAGNFTLTTAQRNSALGATALEGLTTGTDNVSLGAASSVGITTGSRNVVAGNGAAGLLTTGDDNVAIGHLALSEALTGDANIAIGSSAGTAYVAAESSNIVISHTGVVGDNNTIRIGEDGSGAGQQNQTFIAGTVTTARDVTITTGNLNIPVTSAGTGLNQGIIVFRGDGITSGDNQMYQYLNNLHWGHNAGSFTATPNVGIFNMSIGANSMRLLTDGDSNVGMGNAVLENCTTGGNNCAFGYISLNAVVDGDFNTGYGDGTLALVVSGNYNTALGGGAGGAFTTNDSSNICINHPGIAGNSNTLRIGANTGTGNQELNQTFIHGIRGITTGVNDAVAVLIDSAGQLGTVSSSARYKENIEDMADASDAIMNLRPVVFNYKSDAAKMPAYGLIAEEVSAVMPELAVLDKEGRPETVKYHDLPVLLLNELQKLNKRVEELEARLVKIELQ